MFVTVIGIATAASQPSPPELNKPMFFTFLGICTLVFGVMAYRGRRAYYRQVANELGRPRRRQVDSDPVDPVAAYAGRSWRNN